MGPGRIDRRRILAGSLAAGILPSAAEAAKDPTTATFEHRLHRDWAYLDCYREDNARIVAAGFRPDCVFMGDSITLGWIAKRPGFFRPGLVCRGISGQTTPQMLVRFRADVIDVKPAAVHIMAGTNDIAGNTGPMTSEMTRENFMTMAELARVHGIRVILGAIPPAIRFPWRTGLDTVAPIRAHNAWLAAYAAETGAVFADYTAVLADGRGGMRPGFAIDEVHPTEVGYAAMEPVADAAITAALKA